MVMMRFCWCGCRVGVEKGSWDPEEAVLGTVAW